MIGGLYQWKQGIGGGKRQTKAHLKQKKEIKNKNKNEQVSD